MSGLFVKKNLGESLLNKTEAIQKLYASEVDRDIRLFAFSSSVVSDLKPNFLINRPFNDLGGNTINRTKFIISEEENPVGLSSPTRYSFSNGNEVWIESVDNALVLDKRTTVELTDGSRVAFSKDGSLASIQILGAGSQYEIRDSSDNVLAGMNEVLARVEGTKSGSKTAIIKFFIDSADELLDRDMPPEVVDGGDGYFTDETLVILPQCQDGESPDLNKCFNYTGSGNKLFQRYSSPAAAFEAYLKPQPYTYVVKDADEEGFFLFDERDAEWMYLGSQYNTALNISGQVVLKRRDNLEVNNFLGLEKLEGNSRIFNYFSAPGQRYDLPGNLSETIEELFNTVESISTDLGLLYQDVKKQLSQTDPNNRLGTKINIYEGLNLSTSFRMIFRDPDKVLDDDRVTFALLKDLTNPDSIELTISSIQPEPIKIPGIWIDVGGVYNRAYSTDDKPFESTKGKNYLSPMVDRLADGQTNYETGTYVTRNNSGENKYSLSASYLKPGGTTVLGFDTEISVLIQSLSTIAQSRLGGITYRNALTPSTLGNRPSQAVTGWPLFKASNNSTHQFFILAVS